MLGFEAASSNTAMFAARAMPPNQAWRCRGTANEREWTRMGGGELTHRVGECAVAGVDELGHSYHSCSFASIRGWCLPLRDPTARRDIGDDDHSKIPAVQARLGCGRSPRCDYDYDYDYD
jgi:hypothetical protein